MQNKRRTLWVGWFEFDEYRISADNILETDVIIVEFMQQDTGDWMYCEVLPKLRSPANDVVLYAFAQMISQ